jgi:long-chain acyl-CoA synthetase
VAVESLLDWVRRLPAGAPVTRQRSAGQLSAEVSALAASLDVAAGEAVGFALPNGEPWIVGLLALLQAGCRPLLIAADAPGREAERLMASAGARRQLLFDGKFRLAGPPGAADPAGGRAVLLATSGSTGVPKLVTRDEQSLIAEGLRYRDLVGLDGTDRLILPLPLTHAYALGWLAAALITGTQILPLAPSSLTAIRDELSDGATIIALVPTLARLLTLRQRGRTLSAPKLRLAMIGAGPVDEQLENGCRQVFGIPTGRNYGSTETGALFAGLADLPPLCVGQPMPGVRFRIVDADAGQVTDSPQHELPAGQAGLLEVRVGDGTEPWHRTSDLAVADERGFVRILGRRQTAVRRGDRWVSPAEVESALREHPAVRDALVRASRGRSGGEDSVVADVEFVQGATQVDEATLRNFVRQRLSPYKVPERINVHQSLGRDAVGKVPALSRRYHLAGGTELAAAMRAYRRSELLFALADLGLIERLTVGADVDDMAGELGVAAGPVRWLLDIAVGLGILATDETPDTAAAGLAELLGLEAELSRTWLTRQAIADVITAGHAERPFESADLGARLAGVYRAAMHGPHTAARTRLGLRLAGQSAGGRVLEVSAGPGRYLATLLDRELGITTGHLLQTGRLAGPPSPVVAAAAQAGRVTVSQHDASSPQPPAGAFDLCVVANAVHGPGPAADPCWLLDRLAPGGVLLIDDIFLPDEGPGVELGLDWLTHGGMAWPRLAGLRAAITAAGGAVTRAVRFTPPECCLVLAREER